MEHLQLEQIFCGTPFEKHWTRWFGQNLEGSPCDKCILHSESPGLDMKGRSLPSRQPGSSAHRESLSFCCNYHHEEGTFWPLLTLKNGSNSLFVPPLPFVVPSPALGASALRSWLTSLMMWSPFSIYTSVLKTCRPRCFPGRELSLLGRSRNWNLPLYAGRMIGTLSVVWIGIGEQQGTVLWISWMFRMTLLIHKCDIFVACRLTQCSKSIWCKEDLAFFILFMGDEYVI